MINIPVGLWPHITMEEVGSLTEDEQNMLLYICNVLFPVRPPMPTEEDPHPISMTLVRYIRKDSVIDKIKQSESLVKDEFKEILNGLKTKLGIQ